MFKKEWENFANAIIIQAAEDYRKACRIMFMFKDETGENAEAMKKRALKTMSECEKFFFSDYFKTLTKVSGEILMNLIADNARSDVSCLEILKKI